MTKTLYLLVNRDGALHFHRLDETPNATNNKERIASLMKIHGYTDQDAWLVTMTTAISSRPMITETTFIFLPDYKRS